MTKYEQEIYEIVNTSYEHLTVEQIFEKVKKKYPKIVLATVYNNINKLYEADKIRKISSENTVDRYDRIERHDHLICRKCGKLIDFSFADLTEPLKKEIDGNILYYDLKVYTICPECQKKQNSLTAD